MKLEITHPPRRAMVSEERVPLPSLSFSTRLFRTGGGPPVLLLHGSPDAAGEWRSVMKPLDAECTCLAPDLPGLGECEEPPPSFDYSRSSLEAFLDGVLEALSVRERLVLVVHDIGGAVGIPWAAKRVERIRGLVITNTVVFEQFPWFALAKLWARRDFAGRLAASALMSQLGWFGGRIFQRGFARLSPELSKGDLERIRREFALNPKAKRCTLRLFRQMLRPAFFAGVDAMVRDLVASVPTRVVWGLGDPYIPARYAGAFAGAEQEIVPDGGHWIPISAAQRVAAAVRAVLAAPARDSSASSFGGQHQVSAP